MHKPPSPRTRVQRGAPRANYDPEQIKQILDAAWLCHISIAGSQGPLCIPTIFARDGDELLVHGSSKSGLLSQLEEREACVVVMLVDGLVLARSAMHHSVNYRSVILYGKARKVSEREEKLAALDRLINHLLPDRSTQCRKANEAELRATSVYAFDIHEASAKIRSGPPKDDPKDLNSPHWAGVIPINTQVDSPIAAPNLRPDIPVPKTLSSFQLPRNRSC